jgi:hypothetical protein
MKDLSKNTWLESSDSILDLQMLAIIVGPNDTRAQ